MWSLLPSVWPELSCEIHSLHHQKNKFIFGYTNAEDRGLSSRSTEGKHEVYCTANVVITDHKGIIIMIIIMIIIKQKITKKCLF